MNSSDAALSLHHFTKSNKLRSKMDLRKDAKEITSNEKGLQDEACGDAASSESSTVPNKPNKSSTAVTSSHLESEVQMYLDICKNATEEFKNFYMAREIKRQQLRKLTYEDVEPYLDDKEKAILLAHPEYVKRIRKSEEVIAKELKAQMAEQASQIVDSIIKELEKLTEAAITKVVNLQESHVPGQDSSRQKPKNV